jgi:hypothetical protein
MTATPRHYATAGALRDAIGIRLLDRAKREGGDLQRLRRRVAFDRLLARMFDPSLSARQCWVLKGGYALEMRFHEARSTRDLDFSVRAGVGSLPRAGGTDALLDHLRSAAQVRLPDFFSFIVGGAMMTLDQAPEGGARFPVDARLDGRTFVSFHVDLGVGDEITEPLDELVGEDWLGFGGIAPAVAPVLSKEQHWAEKLHAYTRPRTGAANGRVRDLLDLILLIERGSLSPERIRRAVEATFDRRATHPIPDDLLPPPKAWARPFAALLTECGLDRTPDGAHERIREVWAVVRAL